MDIFYVLLLVIFTAIVGGVTMVKQKTKGTSLSKDKILKHDNPVILKEEKPPQCDKKRFNTEVEAQMIVALHENKRKRNKSTHRKEQKVYFCPLCKYWHVSSQAKTLKESEK